MQAETRKLILKNIISKSNDYDLEIHPQHFIELFDRELNSGIYILRNDSNKILDNKINGSWLIRRASIIGNKKMFPFVISYKYFEIYNYIFCYIENKGICELDPRYYTGGNILPKDYTKLKIRNVIFKNMFELFNHYGLTFNYKITNKLAKELKEKDK